MGRNYRDLVAWQKAIELVQLTYRITETFPPHEQYTLTSQLRRAAISIPSNIAEGQGRASRREFRQFLSVAHGSVRELETQVIIAEKLSYLTRERRVEVFKLTERVGRLIRGLINAIAQETRS